jgi:hypothetical protein
VSQGLRIEPVAGRRVLGGDLRGHVALDRARLPNAREVELTLVHKTGEGLELVAAQRCLTVEPPEDRAPFSLPIPPRAAQTFSCTATSASWFLMARAKTRWGSDPTARAAITVKPLEVPDREAYEHAVAGTPPVEALRHRRPHAHLVSLVFLSLLALPLVVLVLGVLLVVAVPLSIPLVITHLLTRTRLRALTVTAPEGPFLQGEWLPLDLSFRLRKPVRIKSGTFTFTGAQTYTVGSGDNAQSVTRPFSEHTVPLFEAGVIAPEPGAPVDVQARLWAQVPRDGFPSAGGKVHYQAKAQFDLDGWPDVEATAVVEVVSARLPGSERPEADRLPADTPGLIVVGEHEEVPFRVDAAALEERSWPWLVPLGGGLGLLATSLVLLENPSWVLWQTKLGGQVVGFPDPGFTALTGALLILASGVRFAWKVTR